MEKTYNETVEVVVKNSSAVTYLIKLSNKQAPIFQVEKPPQKKCAAILRR